MSNLSFRKPPYIMHDEFTSWSNKYHCFLGHHYHTTAHECWVIGAINIVTGVSREWHINTMPGPEGVKNVCKDPKASALIEYENFKTSMERKPEYEEETDVANKEWELHIKPFLEREGKRRGLSEPSSPLQPGKDRSN